MYRNLVIFLLFFGLILAIENLKNHLILLQGVSLCKTINNIISSGMVIWLSRVCDKEWFVSFHSFLKFRVIINKQTNNRCVTNTSEINFFKGFALTQSIELETYELDFLKGFPFTSTELVTIRNGFPQWIWKHQNWISSKDFHSQVQNW